MGGASVDRSTAGYISIMRRTRLIDPRVAVDYDSLPLLRPVFLAVRAPASSPISPTFDESV